MKTKGILLAVVAASLIFSCKKKDSSDPETPETPPVKAASTDITFGQTIGNSGSGLTDFNFNFSGSDMAWGLATDGNFVYVADFGNSCVKKVDLSTSAIVGWYGFKGSAWGYYTDNTAPVARFKPTRIIYKNNNLYVFSRMENWGKSKLYKFDVAAAALDTSREIPVYSFFTTTVDNNENVIVSSNDSIKIYSPSSGVTRFGGFGSADGKLDNIGVFAQVQSIGDTIVVIDGANDRIQKFSSNGAFISKFAINSSKDYTNFVVNDSKYYFLQQGKLAEYSPGGSKISEYIFKGTPNGFSPSQKQYVVAGNKVIFQDGYSHRLQVYTK